jgi:hypothetical protein
VPLPYKIIDAMSELEKFRKLFSMCSAAHRDLLEPSLLHFVPGPLEEGEKECPHRQEDANKADPAGAGVLNHTHTEREREREREREGGGREICQNLPDP